MSAIEAASVKVATMADGTLRITCDIEPAHAQAAFALFGSPGTPMALVALKTGHAALSDEVEAKPKGGELAKLAGMWCADPTFRLWLKHRFPDVWEVNDRPGVPIGNVSASVLRAILSIESRAEIDNDPRAEERFQRLIRGPYMKHCMTSKVTA